MIFGQQLLQRGGEWLQQLGRLLPTEELLQQVPGVIDAVSAAVMCFYLAAAAVAVIPLSPAAERLALHGKCRGVAGLAAAAATAAAVTSATGAAAAPAAAVAPAGTAAAQGQTAAAAAPPSTAAAACASPAAAQVALAAAAAFATNTETPVAATRPMQQGAASAAADAPPLDAVALAGEAAGGAAAGGAAAQMASAAVSVAAASVYRSSSAAAGPASLPPPQRDSKAETAATCEADEGLATNSVFALSLPTHCKEWRTGYALASLKGDTRCRRSSRTSSSSTSSSSTSSSSTSSSTSSSSTSSSSTSRSDVHSTAEATIEAAKVPLRMLRRRLFRSHVLRFMDQQMQRLKLLLQRQWEQLLGYLNRDVDKVFFFHFYIVGLCCCLLALSAVAAQGRQTPVFPLQQQQEEQQQQEQPVEGHPCSQEQQNNQAEEEEEQRQWRVRVTIALAAFTFHVARRLLEQIFLVGVRPSLGSSAAAFSSSTKSSNSSIRSSSSRQRSSRRSYALHRGDSGNIADNQSADSHSADRNSSSGNGSSSSGNTGRNSSSSACSVDSLPGSADSSSAWGSSNGCGGRAAESGDGIHSQTPSRACATMKNGERSVACGSVCCDCSPPSGTISSSSSPGRGSLTFLETSSSRRCDVSSSRTKRMDSSSSRVEWSSSGDRSMNGGSSSSRRGEPRVGQQTDDTCGGDRGAGRFLPPASGGHEKLRRTSSMSLAAYLFGLAFYVATPLAFLLAALPRSPSPSSETALRWCTYTPHFGGSSDSRDPTAATLCGGNRSRGACGCCLNHSDACSSSSTCVCTSSSSSTGASGCGLGRVAGGSSRIIPRGSISAKSSSSRMEKAGASAEKRRTHAKGSSQATILRRMREARAHADGHAASSLAASAAHCKTERGGEGEGPISLGVALLLLSFLVLNLLQFEAHRSLARLRRQQAAACTALCQETVKYSSLQLAKQQQQQGTCHAGQQQQVDRQPAQEQQGKHFLQQPALLLQHQTPPPPSAQQQQQQHELQRENQQQRQRQQQQRQTSLQSAVVARCDGGSALRQHDSSSCSNQLLLQRMHYYGLPTGALFRYVSCPHYLAELLLYVHLALLVPSPTTLACLVSVAATMTVSAQRAHTWYRRVFGDSYPAERKGLIPFVF